MRHLEKDVTAGADQSMLTVSSPPQILSELVMKDVERHASSPFKIAMTYDGARIDHLVQNEWVTQEQIDRKDARFAEALAVAEIFGWEDRVRKDKAWPCVEIGSSKLRYRVRCRPTMTGHAEVIFELLDRPWMD